MTIRNLLHELRVLLGVELTPTQHPEKVISAIGGFIGIAMVILISTQTLGVSAAGPIVASMGASAVLLFAVPHGSLSQPWPFMGGHVLSALAGVTCARFIPWPVCAAAAAVGLAIGVMYYCRCIHPPGGATALTAVLAGPGVHAMGYHYVLTPVLINAAVLLAIAVAVNVWFPWRRYPAALIRRIRAPHPDMPTIHHDHLTYALRQMGSLIDVTEDDLAEIYALALHHAGGKHLTPDQIRVGGCYANDRGDPRWSVRQVVDELPGATPAEDVVLYWTVAGHAGRGAGTCTRAAMALWAQEEVAPTAIPQSTA